LQPLGLRQRSDEVSLEFVHQTPERTVLALKQAGELFRNTPELLLRFGSESADIGEFNLAAAHWHRTVLLRPAMFGRVLGRGVRYQNFPLDEVIPDQSDLRRRADEWLRSNGISPLSAFGSTSSRHSVRSNP